jgi:hypothetical protein
LRWLEERSYAAGPGVLRAAARRAGRGDEDERIAPPDRLAQPELGLGLHGESPERLVERVAIQAPLGSFKSAVCVVGGEAGTAEAFEQLSLSGAQAAGVGVDPHGVPTGKRLAAQQPEAAFEQTPAGAPGRTQTALT